MNRKLATLMMACSTLTVVAQQHAVKGKIVDKHSGRPLAGVSIIVRDHNNYVESNNYGEFTLELNPGTGQVILELIKEGYQDNTFIFNPQENTGSTLGEITLTPAQDQTVDGSVFHVDESQIGDEDGSNQTFGTIGNASDDLFLRNVGFTFSPMRFNIRGYNQNYTSYYINGVGFNDAERGRFNFSGIGGMNSTFKNRTVSSYTQANDFGFGELGGSSNIDIRSSHYAPGGAISIAGTNRSYVMRGTASYATGLLENGWAFNGSFIYRYSDEGAWDGTFYNSWGYFLGAEKVFNQNHSLSIATWGAPTQRGQQGAVTQEAYDLAGSIYYNPYWGMQNGEKRNSRVVESYDPTAVISYVWNIDRKQQLNIGTAARYNTYSSTALGFYNAPDPRPDYYRYMPSWAETEEQKEELTALWQENKQLNWDELYRANYINNEINPDGIAKYAVEERHNDLFETTFNANYVGEFLGKLKVTGGIEGKYSKGMHYKTMSDLLGANQWIDIDQFAERDFPADASIIQNNLLDPNRVIKAGDTFGYNYDINTIKGLAYIQNEWTTQNLDFYYAAKLTYTNFHREGYMLNGRAEAVGADSYGKGKSYFFMDPSFKGGVAYKINGRNRLSANILAESRAPLASNAYISPRIKDTRIQDLQSEQVLSYDLNYEFTYRWIQGRISGYRTHFSNVAEMTSYYDDSYQTFINNSVSGLSKLHQGVEAAIKFTLSPNFDLTAMGTFADYRYTSNGEGVFSAENGSFEDIKEKVMTDGLYLNAGPQIAAALKLNYFHPKMWFADVTVSYYDKNYLDFAPNHYTESLMLEYTPEQKAVLATQEKLPNGFLVDASLGKLIYLNRGQSLNLNLTFSNLLNNTNMITGGYQQGRLPLVDGQIDSDNLSKFPNKYYYAQGFNFFINLGYKF